MFSSFGRAAGAFTLAALVTAAAQPATRRYVVAISNTRAIQNLIDRAAREGGGLTARQLGIEVAAQPRGLQPLQSSGPPSRSLPHGSMAV
jgi:hypothetical protein